MSRIKALFYTRGRFGKSYRETLDRDNEYLYARGHYPTKIKKEDLPEDFVEFHSRSIWYMYGYLKTSGVIDVGYKPLKINHLFKDDYIYISYKEKLKIKENDWGSYDYENYDLCISGNSIIPILLSIEKYSNVDTTEVRNKILDKVKWFKEEYPDDYERNFDKGDIDIFEYYK